METPVGRPARLLLGGVFLAYFVGTSLLYFHGPWTYPMPEGSGRLVSFLIAVQGAFAAGYLWGSRARPRAARLPVSVGALVLLAAAVDLLLVFPTSALATGHWLPNPFAALRDLGRAYSHSLTLRQFATPYAFYVRMFLAPLLAVGVPLGVYYWSTLSWKIRGLLVISVVATIALYVAMGANAGVVHWGITIPWFVLAAHLAGVQRLGRRTWLAAGAVVIALVVLGAVFFTATMRYRPGSHAYLGYVEFMGAYLGDKAPDTAYVKAKLQSPEAAGRSTFRVGLDGLAFYLSHGYYAVHLSLHQPFVACYGVGNSMFLQRQAARLTGNRRILWCPYPARLGLDGWYVMSVWTTIYPWIASDVSFPGTLLVMGLIGWLSASVWVDVLGGRNPIAVAVLGQLLILLYYVPAHNKIMQTGEGVFAFGVLLIAWLLTRGPSPLLPRGRGRTNKATPAGARTPG